MKIMVVNNNVIYESGDGLFVYKETRKFYLELLKKGNEVIIFQFKMKCAGEDFLADFNIRNHGFNIVTVNRKKSELSAYLKAFFVGYKTIRQSDFIYLFYPGHICTVFALLCWMSGKKFGFYIRGQKGIMSKVSRFLYKKAQITLTISPSFTSTIKTIGAKAETIRPMMEISENDIVVNREYKQKSTYNLLFVGRIERAKGTYELVTAVKFLVEKGIKNFKLNFIGDGADSEILKNLSVQFNLTNHINFYGTITNYEQLCSHYKNADIFILPSHHEGFPRVIYEAMIFGVPIITTFVGSISFLMMDKINCHKIEPHDPHSIFNKLSEFIQDYESNAKVAKAATDTITNYLSDKKISHAEQLLKAITT